MAAAPVVTFRARRRPAEQWSAVIWLELLLRLRDTNVPIMAACVAALCILLTPSADANYAVISFGGMKPVMSADSALVAAGLVLGLLMVPVYALGLGLGCVRDRRLRTGSLLATSPVDGGSIAGGRFVTNALIVIAFSFITLILVALAIGARMHSLPGAASMAAYLLIVVPAGMCALPLGAVLDRYFGEQHTAKAITMILFWSVLATASVTAASDVFGFAFLRQNAPAGTASDFSVGVISGDHLGRIPWTTVQLTSAFAVSRIVMLGAAFLFCIAVWQAARTGLLKSIGRATAWPESGSASAVAVILELPRLRPRNLGPVKAGWIVIRRWLQGNRLVALLFVASVTLGIASSSVRLALGVALLIPLVIVNARRISGLREVRLFERSNPALRRPSPLLFTSLLLAIMTLVPIIPVLAQVGGQRGIHLLFAIAASCLWLTLSCAGIARPLMGISIFTMAWYIECFGNLPPAADLFGFGATSLASLIAVAGLTIALGFLTYQKDSYGAQSTRNA